MRVSGGFGLFYSPAGAALPAGLDSVLATQALFPPTSHAEMAGEPGDNEIADAADETEVWRLLGERLEAIPKYREMFAAAFPKAEGKVRFADAGNAIAAFEVAAFTTLDTPFDRYIAGDNDALSAEEKRGAALFYGNARCANCHSGGLMTDQEAHAICAPQLGPGKEDDSSDPGRALVTGRAWDRNAFRTPPLRNVALTGPYMHSGAYASLEDAVKHHLDPAGMLKAYDASQLPAKLRSMVQNNAAVQAQMLDDLDPALRDLPSFSSQQISDLVAFMHALTDPAAVDMAGAVPKSVPSGLAVDR